MELLKPPTELITEGNVAENFRKFKFEFETYSIASGLEEKTDKVKCATSLHVIGEDGRTICKSFDFDTEPDRYTYNILLSKFQDYFEPRKNIHLLWHEFLTRTQGPTECTNSFITDLKNKAKNCEFNDLKDDLIIHRIVIAC
ncbi:Uncharacterised protein g8429 [Pycnogonum litorale]